MRNRLRQIFILAVFASAGLLCLQVYWISLEWSRSKDILQREVDYSFQQAIDGEWNQRKDTLSAYLSRLLHDTGFVQFNTRYNEKQQIWMVIMYDPQNEKDYFSWSNTRLKLSGPLTPVQKDLVIDRFVQDNIRKSVASDVIFYYTQRFGKVWAKKYEELKLDTLVVNDLFRKELAGNKINTAYSIFYADTSRKQSFPGTDSRSLYSKRLPVNFSQVNDPDKRYLAQARVASPVLVLLKRMWLIVTGSLLLLGLTFFCLYRMYRTIIRQKQLDEMKDDFISNMTHELKTPIATVTAAVDGLQYYDALQDQQRTQRYLDTSRKELRRLDEMVSKVLELSVHKNLGQDLRKERFLLKEFLEQILSSFTLQKGLSWAILVNDNLKVNADRERLSGVFQNLVENAIKYGNEETVIQIDAKEEYGFTKIFFSDDGPGVDAAFLPYIFNKFYRVPSSQRQVKGFGLGLFQVSSIIAAHSGMIEVKSINGLSFIISLPAN